MGTVMGLRGQSWDQSISMVYGKSYGTEEKSYDCGTVMDLGYNPRTKGES